jgi:ABC-2 type transport system ATP-binding protein
MTVTDRASGSRPPLLEALEVTKRHWDDFLALDTVSLAVHPGEIYCLLGAADSGKTLLLHTFLGFVMPTAGRVSVCGVDVTREPVRAREQLTYIPHGAALYGSLTARQNLEFFTCVDGTPRAFSRTDYYNAMRTVGIADRYFERAARDLGPAVRLSLWLAIGLLKNTPILMLDEPTVGLDLYSSAGLRETLLTLRERGKGILVVTSDVLLVGGIADRVGILKEGRKGVELSRAELVGRSLPELYLEYMGTPMTVGIRELGR